MNLNHSNPRGFVNITTTDRAGPPWAIFAFFVACVMSKEDLQPIQSLNVTQNLEDPLGKTAITVVRGLVDHCMAGASMM